MSFLWLGWVALVVASPSPAAARLQESGDHEAASGRWDSAGRFYEQAHRAAPAWVTPWLALGRAALEQGALADAGSWYDGLALAGADPGRTAAALAECIRREQSAAVPAGACLDYLHARLAAPDRRREALEAVVAAAPGLAPAWADLVPLRPPGAGRMAALRAGLGATPEPGTYGVLVVQLQAAILGG